MIVTFLNNHHTRYRYDLPRLGKGIHYFTGASRSSVRVFLTTSRPSLTTSNQTAQHNKPVALLNRITMYRHMSDFPFLSVCAINHRHKPDRLRHLSQNRFRFVLHEQFFQTRWANRTRIPPFNVQRMGNFSVWQVMMMRSASSQAILCCHVHDGK